MTALIGLVRARGSAFPDLRDDTFWRAAHLIGRKALKMAADSDHPDEISNAAQGVAKQAEAVRQTAHHLEASVGAVQRSTAELTESADRRTILSANRTALAAERTYAAWIRTGLVAFAGGVGARAMADQALPRWVALGVGMLMIVFAMFCFGAAVWRNLQPIRPPQPDMAQLPGAILIAFSVLLIAASMAAMVYVLI